MGAMSSVRTHEVAVLKEDKRICGAGPNPEGHGCVPPEHEGPADGGGGPAVRNGRRKGL
jgi:hypothetical protein